MQIYRSEYPRPQFERANWLNLNGQWQFEFDNNNTGEERGLFKEGVKLQSCINVPFCPESKLSGIQNTDFINGVWYKRSVDIPADFENVLLHFGAADYHCKAYVNGILAGEHKGGYTSFSFDVTKLLHAGENEICVYCQDDTRSSYIPSGKQFVKLYSAGCRYTRTTGIWQTVWLEFLPKKHIEWVKYYPNPFDGSITVTASLCGKGNFKAEMSFEGESAGNYELNDAQGIITFCVKLSKVHLWEVGNGRLYDVEFTFEDDSVKSYFGLRQVRIENEKFLINGKSVFGRWILDQGYYPDGIYTAPTDQDLENDIKLSIAAGFNGARLHQKVFEERYLYHADRLGYIV